jgi:hypothetical protein
MLEGESVLKCGTVRHIQTVPISVGKNKQQEQRNKEGTREGDEVEGGAPAEASPRKIK